MSLVLAPKPTSNHKIKNRAQKYLRKSRKWKILQHKIGDDLTQKPRCIDTNQEFTRYRNRHNILTLFEELDGYLSLSFLSSLTP
jgi:hypothetical protein